MADPKDPFLSNIVPDGEMKQSVSAHGVVYTGTNTDLGCGPLDVIGNYSGKQYGTQKRAWEGMADSGIDDYSPPKNFWK